MKKLSARGEQLIKGFEGLRLTAYQDQAGIWTIGWGHTGPEVHAGLTCTAEQAHAWFDRDNDAAESVVNRLDRQREHGLTQAQFDALVSFEFNTGALSNRRNGVTRAVIECRDDVVDDELLRWNKITDPATRKKVVSPGLKRRRLAEADLWASGASTHAPVTLRDLERTFDATSVPVAPPTKAQEVASSPGVQGSTIATVSAVLATATEQIQPLTSYSDTLRIVFVVLALAGVAFAIHGAMRRKGAAA